MVRLRSKSCPLTDRPSVRGGDGAKRAAPAVQGVEPPPAPARQRRSRRVWGQRPGQPPEPAKVFAGGCGVTGTSMAKVSRPSALGGGARPATVTRVGRWAGSIGADAAVTAGAVEYRPGGHPGPDRRRPGPVPSRPVCVLGTEDDIEVVAEAANGEEAVAKAEDFAPDVVLMDVRMPRLNGIEATRPIRETLPVHQDPDADGERRGGGPVRGHQGRGQRLPAQGDLGRGGGRGHPGRGPGPEPHLAVDGVEAAHRVHRSGPAGVRASQSRRRRRSPPASSRS